jgi:amino acid adenylation domain-containing protein
MLSSPIVDLARRARSDADRTLIVDGQTRLSFAQVHALARAVARDLAGRGVRRGDRVGVLMDKSWKQAIAQLGILAAGGVVVPISELLKADQAQHILRDCEAGGLIVAADRRDRLDGYEGNPWTIESAEEAPGKPQGEFERILAAPGEGFSAELIGQDSAAIIYSSGSTGRPKGIVLSHRNLWDGARIVTTYLGLGPDDRLAQVMSLNFDYGLNQLFGAIHVGAELHFAVFHFPADLFAFVRESGITTLALMPIFLNRLFDPMFFKPEMAAGIDRLRRITTSGGRMQLPVVRAIRETFPRTDLYLMYGLTEAFRSTYLPPSEVDRRPGSIGRAIPDAQIMVLDENGEECPPDVPGELVHRGGVISKGYWRAPEKTAERFKMLRDPSGHLETVVYSGDLVRRDAEGFIYFLGRKDNMIKTMGHRVSPEEIERMAERIDGIEHAVAFGREHPVLGEEIVLVCIGKEGEELPEEARVKRFLREKLPPFMVPQRLLFRTGFGVTPGNQGKVDRTGIRRIALAALEAG